MSGGGCRQHPSSQNSQKSQEIVVGEQSEGIRLWLFRLFGIDPGQEAGPVLDARLVVDGLQVILHRLLGQGQGLGDLTVRGPPHQVKDDFPLAIREIPGDHFL